MGATWNQIGRLGVYMRSAARKLKTDEPMNAKQAFLLIAAGSSIDIPYMQATLMRLAERGVAREVEGGFVRGENWEQTAAYYGWKD